MRVYIKKETDLAFLLFSEGFKERWIPKKAVTITPNSEKTGMHGISYEMTIEKWALNLK